MNRRTALKTTGLAALALTAGSQAIAGSKDDMTKASFDTVMAFMGAMGSGDEAKVAEIYLCATRQSERRQGRLVELV